MAVLPKGTFQCSRWDSRLDNNSSKMGVFHHLNVFQEYTLCQPLCYCLWIQGEQDRYFLPCCTYIQAYSLADVFCYFAGHHQFQLWPDGAVTDEGPMETNSSTGQNIGYPVTKVRAGGDSINSLPKNFQRKGGLAGPTQKIGETWKSGSR